MNNLSEKAQTDLKLIIAARDGDQRAYSELMNRYSRAVHMEVRQRIKDSQVQDDLTMEILAKAFTQLNTYEPKFAFSTWLKRITVNHCIDYLRKKKLQTVSISNEDSEDQPVKFDLPSLELHPDQVLERNQRLDIVNQYIKKLKDMYRSLIELRYFDELSYEEIAKLQAIPVGTVKARLHRAKGMLGQMMTDSDSWRG